jgi:diguanylate cyclase (GGDEF)-like protein/PAS domain S-box-containing protein
MGIPVANDDEMDFQFLAENSADLICRARMDQVIEYLSPSSVELLGWTPEERIGGKVSELIIPEDLPVFEQAYQSLLTGEDTVSAAVRMRRKNGSTVWMEANARLVRDPATNKPSAAVVIMRDITERKTLEEKLSTLARTDGLTGILNRRAFDEALRREWKRTLRQGSLISLLLLDIDQFKLFNDRYGHQAGDDCLRAAAATITASVRATDIVARYGGEEIAIILPSTGASGGIEAAEKIRAAIQTMQFTNDAHPAGEGWITASIGVATALGQVDGTIPMPEALLRLADKALYKAKRAGRNRVESALVNAPAKK